ncbi:MAG: PAS domain S-box protein, partial [Alphaproteobacteria bacterium]|nr:PAS domain S-box protein [Candidatus Nitrobium versatile]
MSKIISTGYGLAIAIFIAISLFSYVNTAQLIHHIEVRTRSFAIIERLEVLLTDVMNAEMGRHDYVITGEKQHLVFYRNSAAAAERGLQEVRALVSGDPDQERRLAELEYQVKRRIANLDASIAFHRQRGFDAAAQRSFTDEGNRIYQSIEKTFNEMKNIERRMLRESGAAQKAFATRTLSTIIAGTLLGFGILFWITYSLNRVVIEKVRAESSLRESRDFLEKIMQSVTNAIYVLDRNDTFVQVNRSIGSITGYEGNELVGKPFSVLFDPDTLPRMHELFEKVCVHGLTLFHQETEIVRKDGSRRIVSLSAAPLFENSTVVGVIGAAEDITERKQAEKRLSEYIGELEARNREIGILSEMGSMLQACASSEECVSLIARWAERLFSEDSGAVYLINGQRDILEAVILWGESLPDERSITTQDCWALRMGRPYSAEISRKGMVCPHIKHEVTSALLCIPMVAQGEILGLLHLVPDGGWSGAPEERREHIMKSKEKLAETVAESIGLSVANFRLRETLFQQSIHDPLTGLYNRRYMDGLLQK